jgi:hypothetical protein
MGDVSMRPGAYRLSFSHAKEIFPKSKEFTTDEYTGV